MCDKAISNLWEKNGLFNKFCGNKPLNGRKIGFTFCTNINSRWIKYDHAEIKNIIALRENSGKYKILRAMFF